MLASMSTEQQTDQPPEQRPAAEKRKPRGKPFTGGDDPRLWQNMESASWVGEDAPLAEADLAAQTRADILHVYGRPKSADKTPGQMHWRRMQKERLGEFNAAFMELVKAAPK